MNSETQSLRSTMARLLWFLAESLFALGLWLIRGEGVGKE